MSPLDAGTGVAPSSSALDAVASLRARLWDGGFRPVALYTNEKRPFGNAWQERARRAPPEAAEAHPDSRAANTGLLADGFRILDLDIEDAAIVARLRALAMLMLGDTPCIRTRGNSPRAAMLYRAAEGEPGKRVVSGAAGKVEVLGHGQQLHAFGLHPSGASLTWAPESPESTAADQIPAITETALDAFLAAVAPMIGAEPGKPEAARERPHREHREGHLGAEADHLDVAAALAVIPNNGPADWEHWNNVGMAAWAATGDSMGGFAAWVAWSERHPAHDAAACKERWQHYRTSPPTATGADKLFKMAAEARPGWRRPSEWEPAHPAGAPVMSILDRSTCPAPELPLAVFGPFWAGWIAQAAEGANAPPDYVALPLLALASSLLGNARWVVAWRGWAEPPALWCASVGNPSSGKSSGASPVTRDVLAQVERHLSKGYPQAVEQWETVASVAKAVLKQWEKDAAKAIKTKTPVPEKPPEAKVPPKPIRPRARAVDATVEKLAPILEGLPKGILYVRDELAGWLMNLSRYSNGTDRPFWLEAYVGGPYQVDRVKNPDPVFISHLTIPLFGTIQPDRLADTLEGADDGLPSRFLWTWPVARQFNQPAGAGNIEAAADCLMRLADLQMNKDAEGQSLPSYVHLAPEGRAILTDFGQEMQARENTAHGLMKSALGKARGQTLRLAMVMEYLWWCGAGAASAEPPAVSLRAMQAAAGLMDAYFLPMARRVLGDASIPQEERLARTLATWIMETRPERVNVSDIRDGARLPGLRESDAVKAACRFLVDARWLTEAPLAGARGRPRGDYLVNTKVWEAAP